MLVEDAPGTASTLYLSLGAEDIPLLNEIADVVVCCNTLDHIPDPKLALEEIRRIMKGTGVFYLNVDIGGPPTPDEPSPMTMKLLKSIVEECFSIVTIRSGKPPRSEQRNESIGLIGKIKSTLPSTTLNKEELLRAYYKLYNQEK